MQSKNIFHREYLFQWYGINTFGFKISGTQLSTSKEKVLKQLNETGIIPLAIKKRLHFNLKNKSHKITNKEITHFTEQLAHLLAAGISLIEALMAITKNCQHPKLHETLMAIVVEINTGKTFAAALSMTPELFDSIYIGLINAGEQSGQLAQSLSELALYRQRLYQIKKKISKALFYPTIVLSVAFLVTTGVLTFIIPQFESVFASFNAQLPWLTRLLIQGGNTLSSHWIGLVISISFISYSLNKLIYHSITFKKSLQNIILKLPIIGRLINRLILLRWARVLATCLTAGIPLLKGLEIAQSTLGFYQFAHKINFLTKQICKGETLCRAMSSSGLFKAEILHLIALGENIGDLEKMLLRIADHEQIQLDHAFEQFSQLLEPCLIILVAALIGGLIIALYWPIFTLGSVM